MAKASVLVVEDEGIVAWNIQNALAQFGYTIAAVAASGSEALQKVVETRPDLVLMDIGLRGELDGIETAEQIRIHFNIPVVYLTAHTSDEIIERAKATSPFGYIVKPFQEKELNVTIEIALDKFKVEKDLKAEKAWFSAILQSVGDSLVVTDETERITFMNPLAEALTGWQQEEAFGKHASEVLQMMNTRMPEVSDSPITQAIEQGIVVRFVDEWILRSKQGAEIPIADSAAPIRDEAGNIKGVVAIFQDITDRQHAEAGSQQPNQREQLIRLTELERQIQERTAQLQQALKFEFLLKRITDKVRDSLDQSQILQTVVQELTLGLGLDGCDTAWYDHNQALSTISYEYLTERLVSAQGQVIQMAQFPEGYRHLLQGRYFQFCELVPSLRSSSAILACPIRSDQEVLGDLWLFKQPGESFNESEIRLVQQVASQCAIAIRQAELYAAAQGQVTELKRLNQLKNDFLDTVSHELRTPISNIHLAIQLLELALQRQGLLSSEPSQITRYLQILRSECEREISLITNLLDLQQLSAETGPLTLTAISLETWLPFFMQPFEADAQRQQQTLLLEVAADLPSLTTELPCLGRILRELLNNALKYTPSGEQIVVAAYSTPEGVCLSVSNFGVEIPEGELANVFDKFYRVPNDNPWKYSGTGLGLALVKKLVEFLGGSIQVESGAGRTTFSVTLPNS